MNSFLNMVKAHVSAMISQIALPRMGIISAVDPARHMARVVLQPEGIQTGWLPVAAGWSMLELPALGQQVLTVPQEGDADSMHIVGRVFASAGGDAPYKAPSAIAGVGNNAGNTPTNVAPGQEVLIRNAAGGVVRLCPDGSIYIHGNANIDGNVVINGNLTVNQSLLVLQNSTIDGSEHVLGNILAGGSISDINGTHGTVGNLRDAYNAHTHTQGVDSHGDTEQPTNATNLPV